MSDTLPVELNPNVLCRKQVELFGNLPIAQFKRFAAGLASDGGEISAHLKFGTDAAGVIYLRGAVSALVQLVCQRCLACFNYPFEAPLELGFVNNDAAADDLPDRYDPIILAHDATLRTVDLLEDELILQLPIIPRHENENDCAPDMLYKTLVDKDQPDAQRPNPFTVLKKLV